MNKIRNKYFSVERNRFVVFFVRNFLLLFQIWFRGIFFLLIIYFFECLSFMYNILSISPLDFCYLAPQCNAVSGDDYIFQNFDFFLEKKFRNSSSFHEFFRQYHRTQFLIFLNFDTVFN